MDKDRFEEALNDEMDNLLSVQDKEDFARFLADNRSARNVSWWYSRMREGFQNQETMEPPADFTSRVMASVDALPAWNLEVSEAAPKARPLWKWGLAVAAGVVGLVFIARPSQEVVVAVRPTVGQEVVKPADTVTRDWVKADIKLLALQGEVQILKPDGYTWQKVESGTRLNYNDRIRTLASSSVHLTYDDGTELKLKPESMIEVMSNGIRVFHGSSFISVVKKGRHFEARTPNLVASVRGTAYDVTVRYPNKPLDLALADLSQRKELLLKSVSPEVYFRDFTLDALAELSARDSDFSVDSTVKVYESSVFVAPADALGQEDERGIVVSEGQQVNLRPDNWHLPIQVARVNTADYADWGLNAPVETSGNPSTERRGPGLKPAQPGNESPVVPRTTTGEVAPAESFEQFGH